jgi:hypothetical protein
MVIVFVFGRDATSVIRAWIAGALFPKQPNEPANSKGGRESYTSLRTGFRRE